MVGIVKSNVFPYRLAWFLCISLSFAVAFVFIENNFWNYENQPSVVTSVEYLPTEVW